jgi:hypothetical protein
MCASRKQFNLVQDSQTGHKTHCRITHKYAYTIFNVGCRKCYWIWIRNGINFLLSLNIYFVQRRYFYVDHRSDQGKGRKFCFHSLWVAINNIQWYLHCLSLVENGIFHYSKSEFLPIFRYSPLQSAIRHSMPQHNSLTVNYRKGETLTSIKEQSIYPTTKIRRAPINFMLNRSFFMFSKWQ